MSQGFVSIGPPKFDEPFELKLKPSRSITKALYLRHEALHLGTRYCEPEHCTISQHEASPQNPRHWSLTPENPFNPKPPRLNAHTFSILKLLNPNPPILNTTTLDPAPSNQLFGGLACSG